MEPTSDTPISYFATYFNLREGVKWPECTNQANWDEYGQCLLGGGDLMGIYDNVQSGAVARFADVTVYPCKQPWEYFDTTTFDEKVDCGEGSYMLVKGEATELPPRPRVYADDLRDKIASQLGYDDWAHYADEQWQGDFGSFDMCNLDVSHLETMGDVWLAHHVFGIPALFEEVHQASGWEWTPLEASANVAGGVAMLLGLRELYPVSVDSVTYFSPNLTNVAESCGWLEQ